jgi:hypothetical protein
MSNHPSRSVVRRSSADTYAEPDARREPNILFVKKGLFVRRPRAATAQTTIWNLRSQSRTCLSGRHRRVEFSLVGRGTVGDCLVRSASLV